jgi:alpha-tubulin suppressor-like RCC1 family protein
MRAVRSLLLIVATLALPACESTPVDPVDQTDALLKKGGKPGGGGGGEEPPIEFQSIDVGSYRGPGTISCGLDVAGKAYCWGYNGYEWLGVGATGGKGTVKKPMPVLGDLVFSRITVDSKHVCAIEGVEGGAWCWGVNVYGQTGTGSSETVVSHPTPVAGGFTFVDLSAEGYHTCGIVPDGGSPPGGAGMCWGRNSRGQLGDGTTTDRNGPVGVTGGLRFVRIYAGSVTSCGILATGEAYCWGDNSRGQLGIGTVSEPHLTPVLIPGGRRFAAFAISGDSNCGLTSSADPQGPGRVLCWGDTDNGGSPTPTEISPGDAAADLPFKALVGRSCAIGASDQAYCWGENEWGQIGLGEPSAEIAVPRAVAAPGRFASIGGKGVHTCGIGLDGYAYCWGFNLYGELGDGSTRSKASPVRVSGQ